MEISAAKFKQMCLELMDRVAEFHEEIIITKRGKPVAKLVALNGEDKEKPIYGCMAGTFKIVGDIEAPPEVEWDIEKGQASNE